MFAMLPDPDLTLAPACSACRKLGMWKLWREKSCLGAEKFSRANERQNTATSLRALHLARKRSFHSSVRACDEVFTDTSGFSPRVLLLQSAAGFQQILWNKLTKNGRGTRLRFYPHYTWVWWICIYMQIWSILEQPRGWIITTKLARFSRRVSTYILVFALLYFWSSESVSFVTLTTLMYS